MYLNTFKFLQTQSWTYHSCLASWSFQSDQEISPATKKEIIQYIETIENQLNKLSDHYDPTSLMDANMLDIAYRTCILYDQYFVPTSENLLNKVQDKQFIEMFKYQLYVNIIEHVCKYLPASLIKISNGKTFYYAHGQAYQLGDFMNISLNNGHLLVCSSNHAVMCASVYLAPVLLNQLDQEQVDFKTLPLPAAQFDIERGWVQNGLMNQKMDLNKNLNNLKPLLA